MGEVALGLKLERPHSNNNSRLAGMLTGSDDNLSLLSGNPRAGIPATCFWTLTGYKLIT